MATAYLMEWPRINQDQYEKLVRALNWYGKILCGTAMHIPGPAGGYLIVMEVWESLEASTQFFDSLFAQALQKAGLPQPVMQFWEIPSLKEPALAVERALEHATGTSYRVRNRQKSAWGGRMQVSTFCLN